MTMPVCRRCSTSARSSSPASASGTLRLKPEENGSRTYVYHDPCYLGRHNALYDAPRQAIDAIPGIRRVEMTGDCRDRSFCCGGGGLMLFYEPEEEQRMGVVRVQMAKSAGADVIVTACPFCLVNIEDAIKVAGLGGQDGGDRPVRTDRSSLAA